MNKNNKWQYLFVTVNHGSQIPPQKVSANREHLLQVINMVRAKGSTNLSGGLLMGFEHLNKMKTEDSLKRLLILTVGCANRGINDMLDKQKDQDEKK